MIGPLRWPDSPTTRYHQSGPRPGKRVRHEIPRSAPGPISSRTGAPPEGPSSCPCAFCPGVARGKDDGPSTRGRAERAPRKASPLPPRLGRNGPGSQGEAVYDSPPRESLPRPTSRGGAEDPPCPCAFRPKLSLRVLPHSSAPAIPSEARLRMRVLPLPPLVHLGLGPQRGSASRGRRPPGRLLRWRAQPQFRERSLSRM
jgi:hypothetical protein